MTHSVSSYTYNIATTKTYVWTSYGHVALVRPMENYSGNNGDKTIRVKVIRMKKSPKGAFAKGGEEIPVFVEELTESE